MVGSRLPSRLRFGPWMTRICATLGTARPRSEAEKSEPSFTFCPALWPKSLEFGDVARVFYCLRPSLIAAPRCKEVEYWIRGLGVQNDHPWPDFSQQRFTGAGL